MPSNKLLSLEDFQSDITISNVTCLSRLSIIVDGHQNCNSVMFVDYITFITFLY